MMDAQQLAVLCGVSRSTAYRWLGKPDTMPETARRLMGLWLAGRIMPSSWRGWRFDGDKLLSPVGDAMNAVQVEQWRLYHNAWEIVCRDNQRLREYVDYLEEVTPRATVLQLPPERQRPSVTEGYENNPLFHKD